MNIIDITEVAVKKMRNLIAENNAIGLKINVVNGGCMGLAYMMEYVLNIEQNLKDDVELKFEDVKVFLSKKSVVLLAGIRIDFVETPMSSGFTFDNPNAKSNCGCGKSFCAEESACKPSGCGGCGK